MHYFDYERVAREAGISPDTLSHWEACLRQDYAGDQMMVELRLLRACHAVLHSSVTADEITESIERDLSTRDAVGATGAA
jgi:hypothetical protein